MADDENEQRTGHPEPASPHAVMHRLADGSGTSHLADEVCMRCPTPAQPRPTALEEMANHRWQDEQAAKEVYEAVRDGNASHVGPCPTKAAPEECRSPYWCRRAPGHKGPHRKAPDPVAAPEAHNPNIPTSCRACSKPLLLENLFVCDGCPCNSANGVNFAPMPCSICGVEHCTRPGHRIASLFGDAVQTNPCTDYPRPSRDALLKVAEAARRVLLSARNTDFLDANVRSAVLRELRDTIDELDCGPMPTGSTE